MGLGQLIIWHPRALVSLNPVTGDAYWEQPWEVGAGMAIATPVKSNDYLLRLTVLQRFNDDAPEPRPAGCDDALEEQQFGASYPTIPTECIPRSRPPSFRETTSTA